MDSQLLTHLANGGTVVVPQRHMAGRLANAYGLRQRALGRASFASPDVVTLDGWLSRLWQEQGEQLDTRLISRAQSQCLWQQIVAAGAAPGALIAADRAARWAAQAWRDLQHFHISPEAVSGPADTRTFLGWTAEYRERLRSEHWLDLDQALLALAGSAAAEPPGIAPMLWLTGVMATPAEEQLPDALADRGWPLTIVALPARSGRARRIMLPDAAAELAAAADWARGQSAAGATRVALVVPDLQRRREEIRAALGHEVASTGAGPGVHFAGGEPALEVPALGAAVTALEVAAGGGDFGTVSRFLRSPFLVACRADGDAAAEFETRLRRAPAHHWSLFDALRETGFKQALGQACPELQARLLRAGEALGDTRTPRAVSAWTEVWHRYLDALGWPAGLPAETHAEAIRLWQALLAELAGLSAMLPRLEQRAALRELVRVAGRMRRQRPAAAIEIVASLTELGPDHDAVWVAGLDRDQWPPRPQPNPFLPIQLQRAHGMPQADVTQARLAAERAWRYARDVSSELVASWPAVRHEEATRPSWMLQDLPEYHPSARTAAGPAPASELLVIPDPAPPLAGRHLPGGTRGLRAQSNCPLRAFLEMRLGARELDEPTRGLAPWRRGLLAHRALELLYTGIRSSADLGAAVDLRARVRGAIQRAAREQLGPRLRGVQRRVMELERARLAQRIDSLLTVERNRAAFSVSGVELRRSIAVAGITIEARLDRLDTDAEGRLIVIDYKTGAARPAAWLQARPADVQVPLYVLAVGAQTGAAVIVDLKSNPPRYRGLWDPQLNLPGRNSLGSWTLDELTRHWRHEITLLVEEMAAGDARLMPDRPATAQGAFAPVTRIYERLQQ